MIKHITSLLDDDDDCFCRENVQQLVMARQKSKTDYAKRPSVAELRKQSMASAIQEVDPNAEAESN